MTWSYSSHFFASTLNRLSLIFGLVLLAMFCSIGAISLVAYDELVARDTQQTIQAERRGFLDIYHLSGSSGLAEAIESRITEGENREAVYVLADRDGKVRAGHLEDVPASLLEKDGWSTFLWSANGTTAIAHSEHLPNGDLLITGHTTGQQAKLRALVIRLGLGVFALLVALTLLLGWLLRRSFDRSLQASLDVVERFSSGHLRERVVITGGDDTINRLTRTLNRMLDRICDLIGEVRSTTDLIAHDLRTPLTRLITGLESAKLSATNEDTTAALERAIVEADGLVATFNSLLSLARIEGQELDQYEPIDLHVLVFDAVELWQAVAETRGCTIVSHITALRINGHPDLLFQLVSNLLDNAVKFSPDNGRIDVSVIRDNDRALLTIADQGQGIPAPDRDRVFDRFVRLERHRGSPGSGLGLSVVRAIAVRHHALLQLHDAAPGLRVELRFPLLKGTY